MKHASSPLFPFLAACAAIALLSLMDAYMKRLSIGLGAYNALLWRSIATFAIMLVPYLALRKTWPTKAALRLHIRRNSVVVVMALLFFWALARLPLAEAIGLSFVAPVIALFLAALLLGEKIGRNAVIASVFGLVGVAVMLAGRFSGEYRPDAVAGVIAILISAGLFAYNLILARQQALLAKPLEIAFFSALLMTSFLGLASPWLAVLPGSANAGNISLAAFSYLAGLLLFAWAYARAEAQALIPVEYTGFAWAALFGWLYFAEPVTLPTLGGTALIVAGSFIAARTKPRLVKHVETGAV